MKVTPELRKIVSTSATAEMIDSVASHLILAACSLVLTITLAGCYLPAAAPSRPEPRSDQKSQSTSDRGTVFLDAQLGSSYRTNGFFTTQPALEDRNSISYSTRGLGKISTWVGLGLMGSHLTDFEYETSYSQSSFEKDALSFQENRSYGLEKYTLGLNLLPLWRFILPENTPDILIGLPSFRIHWRRSLTQNTLAIESGVAYIPDRESSSSSSLEYGGVNLAEATDGSATYRTKYRYLSLSWPFAVARDKAGFDYFGIWFGVAAWRYSRIYATFFTQIPSEYPLLYRAYTDSAGPEVRFDIMRGPFRVTANIALAPSMIFQSTTRPGLIRDLIDPSGSSHAKLSLSYEISLFSKHPNVELSLHPTVNFELFSNSFDKFKETHRDETDTFSQSDYIFTPQVKATLSIN